MADTPLISTAVVNDANYVRAVVNDVATGVVYVNYVNEEPALGGRGQS